MLDGSLRFLLSEVLLAEYRRVLLRPRIVQWHGLTEADVDRVLLGIVVNATMCDPALPVDQGPTAARGDEHVVALLRAMPGSVLITGDKRLAEAIEQWCEAMTPAAFVATLPSDA